MSKVDDRISDMDESELFNYIKNLCSKVCSGKFESDDFDDLDDLDDFDDSDVIVGECSSSQSGKVGVFYIDEDGKPHMEYDDEVVREFARESMFLCD